MTNYTIRISSILLNINWKVKKSCNIVYFYSNSSGGLDWKLAAQLAEVLSVPHSMKITKKVQGHFTPRKSKFFGFISHLAAFIGMNGASKALAIFSKNKNHNKKA